MTTDIPFESWFTRKYASTDVCFLCGRDLNDDNSTREHIFPQWVLNKFQLWDKKVKLLNGVMYEYKRSVIPCCNVCNNEHLSKLEAIIRNGVEGGYEYFRDNVSSIRIYQWAQLIFYKWLYKETFFREDIKNPESVRIVKENNFNLMALNHLLLRSIDKEIHFENFFPGSVFICHLKTSDVPSKNFDYFDAVPEQCVAIRLGEIGIVVLLADSDLQRNIFEDLTHTATTKHLAPIQFKNFFIECMYRQHIFKDPYVFELDEISENSLKIIQTTQSDFTGHVYGEWNPLDYARLLSQVFGGTVNNFLIPTGIPSFLKGKDGSFRDRPFDDDGTTKKEDVAN
ncbi:hypothetical protein [Dyadobacter pollutisoli]|uniref:HNH endonuclease n=1 Tax=Dyadobacter pollutisoli TaxID=2910158 RepID=A0A9E8N8D9_9BACT|nr:hypothetical protein [Dyadobacter pollutisoli]WAC11243.1 hypothetical protein ON006_26355 [Dyadobacter pollutisoli]